MVAYNFLHREPVYPYHYKPEPPRVCLMAWVTERKDDGEFVTYFAEIQKAEAASRTAWVKTPGRLYLHPVPFSALQSVALYEGSKVLKAFGRPPLADVPAWVENASFEEA
jgi:hypothetical protein